MGVAVLTLEPLAARTELKDLQYYKLTGQKKIIGIQGEDEISKEVPFYLIVDLNKPRILRPDRDLLAQISSNQDGNIVAEWEEVDKVHKLTLQIPLGKFGWSVRHKKNLEAGIDFWGQCIAVTGIPKSDH